jgi:hypothetical protein
MRPGPLRRALVVVGCGLLTVTLSACESTEQESAKIAREATKLAAGPGTLKLGAANRGVRVSDVTLLNSGGRTAVAARLTATSGRAQTDLPVLVTVTASNGKVLYSNDTGGLEASLQRVALLRPGQSVWWVDDQVLTSQTASGVKVRVGTGSNARQTPQGSLATNGAQVSQQNGLAVIDGRLLSGSARAQSRVPVFAVALRAGRVVAAGRAVVGSLPAHATATFQVFPVGSPAGGTLELSAVPASG